MRQVVPAQLGVLARSEYARLASDIRAALAVEDRVESEIRVGRNVPVVRDRELRAAARGFADARE